MPRNSKSALDVYIDPKDLSSSTSRLLVWQALRKYSTKALIPLLRDQEIEVRTSAARQLHMRGGPVAWAAARELCASKTMRDKIVGLFLLSQLGTPRLPYKMEALDLIAAMLGRRQTMLVVEQALYSVGHLRQGKPLKHEELAKWITNLRVVPGSSLAEAKRFALGRTPASPATSSRRRIASRLPR